MARLLLMGLPIMNGETQMSVASLAPVAPAVGLSELAHALRNCLAAGIGLTEIIDVQLAAEHPQRERVRLIAKTLKKATRILHTAVRFSDPGRCQPQPTLPDAVFAAAVQGLAMDEGVRIELTPADDMLLLIDPDQAAEALAAILQNALDASSREIRVEIGKSAGVGRITVSDDGPGIAEKDLSRVFTPFFTTRGGSTGLGLPLAAKLAALNAGRIELESTSAGTKVSLIFPLAPEPAA